MTTKKKVKNFFRVNKIILSNFSCICQLLLQYVLHQDNWIVCEERVLRLWEISISLFFRGWEGGAGVERGSEGIWDG